MAGSGRNGHPPARRERLQLVDIRTPLSGTFLPFESAKSNGSFLRKLAFSGCLSGNAIETSDLSAARSPGSREVPTVDPLPVRPDEMGAIAPFLNER